MPLLPLLLLLLLLPLLSLLHSCHSGRTTSITDTEATAPPTYECRGTPRLSWPGRFNEPRITCGAGQTLAQGTRCTGDMPAGQAVGTMSLPTTCRSLHLERSSLGPEAPRPLTAQDETVAQGLVTTTELRQPAPSSSAPNFARSGAFCGCASMGLHERPFFSKATAGNSQ